MQTDIMNTRQTFDLKVERAAVELILISDLTSVIPTIILLSLNNMHLERVNLWSKKPRINPKSKKKSNMDLFNLNPCITLVRRSKLSFSCRCFPVLLARSIHFPLNHLTVGLRSKSLASTFAIKVMSPP